MNKNIAARDKFIFGEFEPDKYSGGVRHFAGLTLNSVIQLVKSEFLELDERQNCSPTTKQFITYMKKYKGYTAHGYTVIDTRHDYRVTIEGIEKEFTNIDRDEIVDFVENFKGADDFIIELNRLYCWYD